MNLIDKLTLNGKKERYGTVFAIAFFICLVIFIPFIIINRGYFLLYGDFNVQQYPFYMHAHDMIKSGSVGWDFKTDIGANFIGSYSFYNLGSPFFLITLLFPTSAVPYLIGPLLMLKISLCAVTAYAYLRHFIRDKDWAMTGGLLYAFSGYSLFNIFFNHFHEPMIFFPLLLLALEKLMSEDKKGLFCLAVFINAFVNYFFFVGEVVFVVIYFFVRLLSHGNWSFNIGKLLRIAFESVLGLCLSAVLLLPAVIEVLKSPRVDSMLYGWNALLYPESQRYLNILEAMFFPPDLPARPNFTPGSGAKWGSIAAYLPAFGMVGVIAWLKSHPGHWLKRMFVVLMFFAFIPILNSSFMLFNATYYARWFYMLTLITALMTVSAFNTRRTDLRGGFKWAAGIAVAIAFGIGFTMSSPATAVSEAKYGLYAYADRFWVYVAIALVSLGGIFAVIGLQSAGKRHIGAVVGFCAVAVASCAMWIYFISEGQTLSYSNTDYVIPYAIEGEEKVSMPEGEKEKAQAAVFRIDTYDTMDNIAMFWDMSSINAFHSIIPNTAIEFYNSVGIERVVATRPDASAYAVRSLLSVKYLFDDGVHGSTFGSADKISGGGLYDPTVSETDVSAVTFVTTDGETHTYREEYNTANSGWSYVSTSCGHNLWENDFYIPMGFTYDEYITEAEYYSFAESDRAAIMLKAIVLSDEDAAKYDGVLTHMDVDTVFVTTEEYYADCTNRAAVSCNETYLPDSDGFSAQITLSESDLVFFSVPYDEGWSASVNGKKAEIIKVNVGFMAVKCESGENSIRFDYETPGGKEGLLITVISLVVFLAYVVLSVRPKLLQKPLGGFYEKTDAFLSSKPLAQRYSLENGNDDESDEIFR